MQIHLLACSEVALWRRLPMRSVRASPPRIPPAWGRLLSRSSFAIGRLRLNPRNHMKASWKVIAPALALFATSLLVAAEPIKRVMVVTDVETDDATGYAAWIAKS